MLSCQFCAFAAKKRDAHAFENSADQIVAAVQEAWPAASRKYMVGGFILPLVRTGISICWRRFGRGPQLQLKAFTAIEIRHMARRIFKTSVPKHLSLCARPASANHRWWAEILIGVRDLGCVSGQRAPAEWLEVHRTWHQMGGRSTCTMPSDTSD